MQSLVQPLLRFYNSSIGKKIIVAVTGILLLLFLIAHLVGNLLIYVGEEAINEYAVFLHEFGHGAGIWVARFGLLGAVGLHVVTTIQLALSNKAARSVSYAHEATVQASKASKTMVWSGIIILSFVVYHILHFTLGVGFDYYSNPDYRWTHAGEDHHNVFRMVIDGFRNPFISAFYIFSMGLLCLHLSHGVASVFQTLGLRSRRTWPAIQIFGWAYAAVLFFGNISIPLSVLFRFVTY